ncbi:hypothetical protein TorRG33x02_140510, partial [Trema orientale]
AEGAAVPQNKYRSNCSKISRCKTVAPRWYHGASLFLTRHRGASNLSKIS